MSCSIPCPECSGAGFFGGNGPVVESICGYCHGEGAVDMAEDVRPRPPVRAYSVYSDDRNREAVRKIASQMRERADRQGFGS